MVKEALHTIGNAGKTAIATGVGATEGATIGFFMGGPGTSIAGGLIGGATAFAAETAGRRSSTSIIVEDTSTTERMDTPNESVSKTAAVSRENVPLIEVPDTILKLRMQAFSEAIGKWKASLSETTVASQAKNTNLILVPVRA